MCILFKKKHWKRSTRNVETNNKRRLIQSVLKKDLLSSGNLCFKLWLENINKDGYKSIEPKFWSLLTNVHKEKRVKWFQEHKKMRWNSRTFSDESHFQLYANKIWQ